MRIYLDKLSPGQIVPEFLKEEGWIAGLAFLNRAIWKRGIRQYVAMGDSKLGPRIEEKGSRNP